MTFTVVWVPPADAQLARLLADGDVGTLMAVIRLDAVLGHCPVRLGESRAAGERVGFVPPLAAQYHVDEADRVVRVLDIRDYSR